MAKYRNFAREIKSKSLKEEAKTENLWNIKGAALAANTQQQCHSNQTKIKFSTDAQKKSKNLVMKSLQREFICPHTGHPRSKISPLEL